MGMRFHSRRDKAQPIAVTTRVGTEIPPGKRWSIRTWNGTLAPPPVTPAEADDSEDGDGE